MYSQDPPGGSQRAKNTTVIVITVGQACVDDHDDDDHRSPDAADAPTRRRATRSAGFALSATHGRHELPWRATRDRWAVLVAEVMLQQTQVARVEQMWAVRCSLA